MATMSANARIVHGSSLPIISSHWCSGLTIICSWVPWSRSRTSVTAVCWTVTIMMITTMRPGIRKSEERRSGLYQVRILGSSRPMPEMSMPCRSAQSARMFWP